MRTGVCLCERNRLARGTLRGSAGICASVADLPFLAARCRRANVLVATKAGQAAHAKARVDVLRAEDELLAGLDADDRDALGRILRRLAFPAD